MTKQNLAPSISSINGIHTVSLDNTNSNTWAAVCLTLIFFRFFSFHFGIDWFNVFKHVLYHFFSTSHMNRLCIIIFFSERFYTVHFQLYRCNWLWLASRIPLNLWHDLIMEFGQCSYDMRNTRKDFLRNR